MILDTQSVGSVMGRITSRLTMRSSSALIASRNWTGARLGGWITGCTFSSKRMWCSPGNFPIPVNLSGYSSFRSANVFRGLFGVPSVLFVLTAQLMVTNPNAIHRGRPNMTGPGVSAM